MRAVKLLLVFIVCAICMSANVTWGEDIPYTLKDWERPIRLEVKFEYMKEHLKQHEGRINKIEDRHFNKEDGAGMPEMEVILFVVISSLAIARLLPLSTAFRRIKELEDKIAKTAS